MDAKQRKKAKKQDPEPEEVDEESSAEEVEGESSAEEFDDSEIEAVFEGYTPKEGDFHGIKSLLNQLLTGTDVGLSDFADTIISETEVSSVLKVDDTDDEVFGVISALGLKKHGKVPAIKSLLELILAKCDEFDGSSTKSRLSSALSPSSDKNVALLINERMINLPQQLAMSLNGALREDLSESAKEDKAYKFDQFVVICKSVESRSRADGSSGQKKKKKVGGASAAAAASDSEQLFIDIEDDLFQKHSSCSFSFPVPGGLWVSRKGGLRERPSRTVMLLTSAQLQKAWTELDGMLT